MSRITQSLLAVAISVCGIAVASASSTFGGPVTGLWAHPGDGGRGFNIDLQGDTMIVTTFIYTETGAPMWYLSSGSFDHKSGVFRSGYDSYSNGQCFGCSPAQPVVHSEAAGKMTISFHDNQHATLTTPSGPLEIQKLNYGFADANDVLYGEWAFNLNVSGLYSGDWVIFNQPYVASDGTKYVAGVTDDLFRFVGLGRWVSDEVGYLVLIKENNYYDAYQFFADDRRGLGVGWVYPISGSPSGSGSLTWTSRILYKGELQNAKASPVGGVDASSRDLLKRQLVVSDAAEAMPAEISSALAKMRQEIDAR